MRRILALVAGAAVGAAGALILGEYPFSGLLVLGAGLFLGLFVAEAALGVGDWRGPVPAAACAAIAAAAMVWAGWISEGHDLGRVPAEGWLAVALAAAVAGVRVWMSRAGTRTPPGPASVP
jgi:hypothetical protein